MNRHQQRVALLFGLLLISVALLGCANGIRVDALSSDHDLAHERAQVLTEARSGWRALETQ